MNIMMIIKAVLVVGVLGLVFGIGLSIAHKKLYVKVDPRIEQVKEYLGGANCGACGYAGCDAFAEAAVEGRAKPSGCPAGNAKAIGKILGVDVEAAEPKVARLICQGSDGVAKERFEYDGYQSCRVAASIAGGSKLCRYACLGFGDCIPYCAFGAISVKDGVAVFDAEKCTGCGACVSACPRSAIALMPEDSKVIVRCRNSDVARVARAVCMKACIGCGRCTKECKYDAIHVENGFARIDAAKCTRCGECAKVCPCGCITTEN